MSVIKGVLVFHSETGTEGGWYAYQAEAFMHLPPPNNWWCSNCGRIWDKDRVTVEPKPSFIYYDPETKYYKGYDEPHPELTDGGSGDIDSRWNNSSNAKRLECYLHGHAHWQSPEEQHPDGVWSYEGLHMLNNGDYLKVFAAPGSDTVLWEGVVKLTGRNDVYTNSDATVFGMWVNQEPDMNIDRKTWAQMFFDALPCEVTTL